ncbi:MAG: serine hydrolase [Gemmatimonadales bacterium]|nr:MAG: serine hydrolase [Gemmatimonadales bacterium]
MDRAYRIAGLALLAAALFGPEGEASQSARRDAARNAARPQQLYYPGPGNDWEHRRPEEVGMDPRLLEEAIAFAKANESPEPRDLEFNHYTTFGREPYGEAIGPFKPRGDQTGIILRHGYIVAEWGEPHRVDMTFSVTKSFLSTVVGLAWDRGLIRSLDDKVRDYVWTGEFDSEHNSKITWDHLLRQTSDWEGTLWGKPDWADRPPADQPLTEYVKRPRNEPGTSYKYNDVRVNVLAYAALQVWRRPLPQVLKEYVMDPIGASTTWRWYGYENSWVNIDGQMMQSVSGGGHWGGGMWISARDQARFGLLTLRRGRWKDKQIISEEWVNLALTPTPVQPGYGFMNWFLNTGRQMLPSAPENSFCHRGAGANVICCIPDYDLVIVARWIRANQVDGLVRRVLASIRDRAQ